MSDFDWQAEAKAAAEHVYNEMFEAHRGAFAWRVTGATVIFGNDGYTQDTRARREVEGVRAALAAANIEVLGFALGSKGGYSWALLVRVPAVESMKALVWSVWEGVNGGPSPTDAWQRLHAEGPIAKHATRPDISPN